MDNLRAWRADHVVRALWLVAHDRLHWLSLHESKSAPRDRLTGQPSGGRYLLIEVAPCKPLGITAHRLRLWQSYYEGYVRGLEGYQRVELSQHLAKPRLSAVFRLHGRVGSRGGTGMQRGWVSPVLAEMALELERLCEVVGASGVPGLPDPEPEPIA